MNKKHIVALEQINPNLEIVSRFSGGMSNFTYLVTDKTSSEKFVFRYPGDGAYNFVNYENEQQALIEAHKLGLTSETVYFDVESGIKLAKYVEGHNLIEGEIDYSQVAKYLKTYHSSNFRKLKPYDHFGRLKDYEALHSNHNEQYQLLKQFFTELYETKLKGYITKPCHNDSQLANFIVTDNHELFLVDFEYAALNDPIYDIACFGNIDLSNAFDLLSETAFDDREDPALRLYGWRMFQCLQWFNVASYKHEIGLGEALGIDFDAVSNKYITLATTLKTLIENVE
ncbi:choline/ethanolamine kinase family protein [Mollicutes bacterium LVI A0039]|nr:choline/ethanolamine kinase family protein [Mollicutes bacterium LVI A0039]